MTAPLALSAALPLTEFRPVVLRRAIIHRDVVFPAGTRGIVVECHEDGLGYEVEFAHPAEAVLSLARSDLA